ncbi:MAG: hypothetical protein EBR09_13730 [Proteobacteria bacterium]|nr:hypothetical protein [Pseudomonadota bacterium]
MRPQAISLFFSSLRQAKTIKLKVAERVTREDDMKLILAAALVLLGLSPDAHGDSGAARRCAVEVRKADTALKDRKNDKAKWEGSLSRSSCFDFHRPECRDKSKVKTPEAAAKCNQTPNADRCDKIRAEFDSKIAEASARLAQKMFETLGRD